MSLYQPDFDVDFRRGKVGEDLVGTFLEQLAGSTIEVKTDYRADMTGNVYVETWQYSEPDMSDRRQSGINISKADYYCFASARGNGFIMIKTDDLKMVLTETRPAIAHQPIVSAHTNGSEGRLVRVLDIVRQLGLYPRWQ